MDVPLHSSRILPNRQDYFQEPDDCSRPNTGLKETVCVSGLHRAVPELLHKTVQVVKIVRIIYGYFSRVDGHKRVRVVTGGAKLARIGATAVVSVRRCLGGVRRGDHSVLSKDGRVHRLPHV